MSFRHLLWPLSLGGHILLGGICWAGQEASADEYARHVGVQRAKVHAEIPRLARKYGETIGCAFSMDESNVAPYPPDATGAFVALFSIDEGCSGGTRMSRPVFAVLRWGGPGMWDLYVDTKFSLPTHAQAFPQTVDRIYIEKNELRFEARELQPADALCCPSKRLSGRLVWVTDHWEPQ